jgi:hypothetical protein
MMRLLLISVSAALLAACGEPDQSLAAGTNRGDTPPWQGAKNAYVAKDWKPGDKGSWENQLRSRSQYQNEYTKTN